MSGPSTTSHCEHCGFTSKPTTPAFAAHALRLHSCERHLRLSAAHAVHAQRRATYGTVVRECQHPRARHQHGTYAAYGLDGCRCAPCSQAAVRYEANRRKQTAYGRWQPYVDAEPVRTHVQQLRAGGIGWKRIADAAGVSHGGMTKLLYGLEGRQPSRKVRVETAQRLLAVTASSIGHAGAALVPARPTWRRIEGLVALGYPKAWIAEQIGQQRALQLQRDLVLARTEQAVAALHERIGDTPGPSERARRYAITRGWLVPAYGTDEEIAEQARLTAEINREEREARRLEVARLTDLGLSAREIAMRLDIDDRQVTRDRATVREAS